MNLPPMTQNQKLILSFLASTAAGAASAGIAAVVQSYTQQGLNIPVLVPVGIVAFFAFFGPALYNFVPPHIQQIMQAYADTNAMYRNTAQQSQQAHAALTQTVQVLSQVAQKQAVQPAQPLQGSAQPTNTNVAQNLFQQPPASAANSWMLDKPTANTTAVQLTSLQGVQQVPFPPARPVPPQSIPAIRPMESINLANTPVDIASQNTAYTPIPSDLHFGDTGLIPQVGQ